MAFKGFDFNAPGGGQFEQMAKLLGLLNQQKYALQADPTRAVLGGFREGFNKSNIAHATPEPTLGPGFTQLEQLLQKLFNQTFLDLDKPRIGSR